MVILEADEADKIENYKPPKNSGFDKSEMLDLDSEE